MQIEASNYRPNVAIIVTDGKGHVLMCERADLKYEGAWQSPQGGIDPGETPKVAAIRELGEELGLSPGDFELLRESTVKHRYEWPENMRIEVPFKGFIGQEQRFFLAEVRPGVEFRLGTSSHQEFSRVMWGSPADLLKYAWDPKKPGLEAAMKEFGLL